MTQDIRAKNKGLQYLSSLQIVDRNELGSFSSIGPVRHQVEAGPRVPSILNKKNKMKCPCTQSSIHRKALKLSQI